MVRPRKLLHMAIGEQYLHCVLVSYCMHLTGHVLDHHRLFVLIPSIGCPLQTGAMQATAH